MSDAASQCEIEWLEGAAAYIASHSGATEVTTEHVWLAVMANVESAWARLIDDCAGGTSKE